MDLFRFNERYSGDGVDASVISTNGVDEYDPSKTNILNMIQLFIKIFTP